MKKFIKILVLIVPLLFIELFFIGCGKMNNSMMVAEKITLGKTVVSEVEFENAETVKLKQTGREVVVSGKIDAMSKAQISAFGDEGVTHFVVLKFEFDKERTISYFKIQGDKTKVYSVDQKDDGYVGPISDLLDNDESEDAFCYLVLSANTKEYCLTAKYSDATESVVNVKIEATLVTAEAE